MNVGKKMKIEKNDSSDVVKKIVKKTTALLLGKDFDQMVFDSNIKLFSFDLYDTALFRRVDKPEDIFCLVQEKFCDNADWKYSISFLQARKIAEYRARKMTLSGEVTLNDIYSNMNEIHDTDRKILKELEINMELENTYCNSSFKTLYFDLLNSGQKIIFTSDMYLPKEVITNILERCGIYDYENIYISSEFDANKKRGSLFDIILHDQTLKPEKVIHIGDNVRGDFFVPKFKGMHSYLYYPYRGKKIEKNHLG